MRRINNNRTTRVVGRGFLVSSLALLTLVFSSTASAVATITQQPQDVKAAVEWLQTNLANTPSTFTPMAVQSSLNTASNENYRLDLPKKGNRIIISGDNHSSGTTFDAPWDVVVDTLNNRLIVLDQLSDELIAVDPATGAHTVLSNSVTGAANHLPCYKLASLVRTIADNNNR